MSDLVAVSSMLTFGWGRRAGSWSRFPRMGIPGGPGGSFRRRAFSDVEAKNAKAISPAVRRRRIMSRGVLCGTMTYDERTEG